MAFDGYVRVSSTRGRGGDTFISPEQQRDQITRWAELRGATIDTWHEDLDVSGKRVHRPALELALTRAETGVTEGIVVAKIDRFARTLVGALELIRRLDAADAQFVSVAEGIDPSTPAGKMLQRLMLILAEFELDRIRDSWADARRRAVERGVHVSSATPVGYQRLDDGTLQVDEATAKHVRKAFKMAADGAYWRDIGDMLRTAGVQGPYGNSHWDIRAVTRVIHNPVYTGEARSGEYRNPDAHTALVSRSVFEQASKPRAVQRPRRESTALLSGLIRCAGCQHVMKADRMTIPHGPRKGERARIYRCRRDYSSGRCPEPASIAGWVIEPWTVERFFDRVGELQMAGSSLDDDRHELQTALDDAIRDLEAFRDQRIADILTPQLYADGLAKRMATVDDLILQLDATQGSSSLSELTGLDDMWASVTVPDQRRLLAGGVDAVMVKRGRVSVDERAVILWRGELPDNVPRRGKRLPIVSFPWPDRPR